jgi:hypothetical protein
MRVVKLGDLTFAEAVERALDEFDEIGREALLKRYGFGPSSRYYLVRDGRRYDAKAIAGAAVGFQYPESGPMASRELYGGVSANARLTALGFTIVSDTSGETSETSLWLVGGDECSARRCLLAQGGFELRLNFRCDRVLDSLVGDSLKDHTHRSSSSHRYSFSRIGRSGLTAATLRLGAQHASRRDA